jgi:hypothetical protein
MRFSLSATSFLVAAAVVAAATTLSSADELRRGASGERVPVTGPTVVAKLVAPKPVAHGEFGRSVATSGRFIVVGAPGIVHDHSRLTDGSAHVYVRKGWKWVHEQALVANDLQHDESFGRSVAIAGNLVAVGAEHDNTIGHEYAGAVYLFRRTRHGWIRQQKLVPDQLGANDHFGHCLAMTRDTLVAGTWSSKTVYVYQRDGGPWDLTQVIRDATPGHTSFGQKVALFGDHLVVGARTTDNADRVGAGAAIVFEKDDEGVFHEVQKLTALEPENNDHFGSSVSIFGRTIAIGADGDDHGADEDAGSVHIFTRIEGEWVEAKKLIPPTVLESQQFGSSVTAWRKRVVVGAPADAPLGLTQAGCAYDFKCMGDDWCFIDPVTSDDAAVGDEFGEVAIRGYVGVFGARHADHSGVSNPGAAYVVLLP